MANARYNAVLVVYPDDDIVEQFVDGGTFEVGFAGVLHELGVLTSEDDDAITPLRVTQQTPAQKYPVIV